MRSQLLVPRARPRRYTARLGDDRPQPGANPPPRLDRAGAATTRGSGGGAAELRILIVDDDRLMTDFLPRKISKALAGLPVRFLTANTPEEGIRLLGEKPDVVLCDYNLRADATGIDVLAVAAQAQPSAIRILFSGHTSREIGGELVSAPIHAFLEKPMRLDDMIGPFVEVLQRNGVMDGHATGAR